MFVFRGNYCAAWRIRSSPDLRVLLGASAAKSDLVSKGVVWRSCRTSAFVRVCRSPCGRKPGKLACIQLSNPLRCSEILHEHLMC